VLERHTIGTQADRRPTASKSTARYARCRLCCGAAGALPRWLMPRRGAGRALPRGAD